MMSGRDQATSDDVRTFIFVGPRDEWDADKLPLGVQLVWMVGYYSIGSVNTGAKCVWAFGRSSLDNVVRLKECADVGRAEASKRIFWLSVRTFGSRSHKGLPFELA